MAAGDVELVRGRVDIVDLISESVPLKKAGRDFTAPCPFHVEKTPSFHVNPARQSWHCFGACDTGGDVFAFVMKRDKVEFGDALRTLAERAGVSLTSGRDGEDREQHARLFETNEAAVVYFRQALAAGAAGRQAREYAERRGLDAASLELFEIGFAPEGWEHLRSYLRERGFGDEEQLEAGLLSQGEHGIYDRFRGRLIFPIRDDKGRAVGFGGRALGDEKPKYLNTPQTPLFDKGNLLYLMHRAKESIRKAGEVVLVEGYLDAIAAHQFGYTNVVATLGTALTERHIAVLRRLAKRVTLAMDADAAGIQAAVRGEEVARAATTDGDGDAEVVVAWDALVRVQARAPVEVRVFTVPSGKDPDDAIRENPAGWPGWVAAAVPPFEFRLRYEQERTDTTDPRARVELADRLLPLLMQISDPAMQASYVSMLAERAGVHPDRLRERLRGLAQKHDAGRVLPTRPVAAALPDQRTMASGAGRSAAIRPEDRIEAFALGLLLRYPSLQQAGGVLEPQLFQQSTLRQVFEAWRRDPEALPGSLVEALHPAYQSLIELQIQPFDAASAELALLDSVERLRMHALTERKRLLQAQLSEVQREIDQPATAALSKELSLGNPPADSEIPEAVLAAVAHQRDDEYLMREIHALETELRTRKPAPWVERRRASASLPADATAPISHTTQSQRSG